MFKDFLIVGAGSFLGGGMRYLVSRLMTALWPVTFPLGTFTVNVVGCLLIGLLSGMEWGGTALSQSTRLLLVTGFCGGFTTFSTLMNESVTLTRDGNPMTMALYLLASLVVGALALLAGHYLAKLL